MVSHALGVRVLSCCDRVEDLACADHTGGRPFLAGSTIAAPMPRSPIFRAAANPHSRKPIDHSRRRRFALLWPMHSLSAGLTGSPSRKARACATDAYEWSAEIFTEWPRRLVFSATRLPVLSIVGGSVNNARSRS